MLRSLQPLRMLLASVGQLGRCFYLPGATGASVEAQPFPDVLALESLGLDHARGVARIVGTQVLEGRGRARRRIAASENRREKATSVFRLRSLKEKKKKRLSPIRRCRIGPQKVQPPGGFFYIAPSQSGKRRKMRRDNGCTGNASESEPSPGQEHLVVCGVLDQDVDHRAVG